MNVRRWIGNLALTAGLAAASSVVAQTYPSGPVRVIVGYPPGGGSDLVARMVAQQLSDELKQSFFVENKGGASGTIAAQFVSTAAPDGYTLLVAPSTQVITPALMKTIPYDTERDLTPITQVARGPYVLVVNPKVAANDVDGLIRYAKANPGKFKWALASVGSGDHLAVELFNRQAGIETLIVPYKGAGPALNDLLSGEVDGVMFPLTAVMQHVAAGKLRALAITSTARVDAAPGVPTVAESGLPNYQFYTWFGLWGPKGMSEQLTGALNRAMVKALEPAATREKLAGMGLAPVVSTSKEFGDFVRSELALYAKVVKEANITPQ